MPSSTRSFCSILLPDPTVQGHQRRLMSTLVLGVFLFCFGYFAVDANARVRNEDNQLRTTFDDSYKWLGSWTYQSGQQVFQQQIPFDSAAFDDDDEEVASEDDSDLKGSSPDLWQYVWHDRLDSWSVDSGKRLIVIGDIHAQVDHLKTLLSELSFDANADQLVFAGDLVAKGGVQQSVDTLNYVSGIPNVRSVRGNHDQHVIGWRAWMEHASDVAADSSDQDLSSWSLLQDDEEAMKKKKKKGRKGGKGKGKLPNFPKKWKWQSEHFKIAQQLSPEVWQWFKQLPLSIYIPDLYTYVVHAGMLSTEAPQGKYDLPAEGDLDAEAESAATSDIYTDIESAADGDLPAPIDLSYPLESTSKNTFSPSKALEQVLESAPETSVLMQVQNRDGFTLTNVRGVGAAGSLPTKNGGKGQPWNALWNTAMEQCRNPEAQMSDEVEDVSGAEGDDGLRRKSDCIKQNVIYGHWAAKGLQIQDHTFGLDSGCVYSGSLTALIMDGGSSSIDELESNESLTQQVIQIGGREAQLVSLDCSA